MSDFIFSRESGLLRLRGLMSHKSKLTLMLLTIIIFSFPSICFSELKTVIGENCQVYLGDMKNKKGLEEIRKSVRYSSLINGVEKLGRKYNPFAFFDFDLSQYLEKIVVISHTERGRKICEKVRITLDPEVINEVCRRHEGERFWGFDIDDVLTRKSDKINIGLILETKIPDIDGYKKEKLENEEESQFHVMVDENKDKYKVVDRKHLSKILEEQKLSTSGITDSETVKVGKILNLDIIVLRILYDKNQVTKVLKVETGEVLLFRKYETKTEEGWIYYGESKEFIFYYDKTNMTTVNPNVFKVWKKVNLTKEFIRSLRERKSKVSRQNNWDKINYGINLLEVDCSNNTIKFIKTVSYNDEGEIISIRDYVDVPRIEQVLPETMDDLLLRKVCQK